VLGNGREPVRDYIDVADVAGLVFNLSNSTEASLEIYNASNASGTKLSELIKIAETITNGQVKKNMSHLGDGEILYSVGNNSKSIRMANWIPRVSLSQSIENEYQSLLKLRS
jgi:UDP-glucose 4-epimerase